MNIGEFAAHVAILGLRHRASVISWGRTEDFNAATGGPNRSPHLIWMAVVLELDDPQPHRIDEMTHDAASLGLRLTVQSDGGLRIEPS